MSVVQVPLKGLAEFSPFKDCVWFEVFRPVTRWEIRNAIRDGKMISPNAIPSGNDNARWTRVSHIRRIAWLAHHGWNRPIDVDVGVPTLSGAIGWWVLDGNHRHAAAIFRRDTHILADISGDLDYAETVFGIEIP